MSDKIKSISIEGNGNNVIQGNNNNIKIDSTR